MTLEIRPYRAEDRDGLIALVLPIQRDEFGLAITADDQPDLVDVPGFFARGASAFWVASDGAQLVGSAGLVDLGAGMAALRKMFVHAGYRGAPHRLGQRLLDVVVTAARARGVHALSLGPSEHLVAAHRFDE
jgi:hypothetical protein